MPNDNTHTGIDERPGLYCRYQIRKANGDPVDPSAEYFVLRLDSGGADPLHAAASRKAVALYASLIAEHLPELSKDILERYPDEFPDSHRRGNWEDELYAAAKPATEYNSRTKVVPVSASRAIFLRHLSRTPAEPKAGDWEKEMEIHTAVEIHDRFQDDGIGDTEYVRLDEARALSSAAPRITEDCGWTWDSRVGDVTVFNTECGKQSIGCPSDGLCKCGKPYRLIPWNESAAPLSGITEEVIRKTLGPSESWTEYEYRGARRLADDLIALLRSQDREERPWISVEERLPKKNTPIFIRWGDEKASPDTSPAKDSRIADTRIIHLMRIGKIGWWCERRVFVDTPPPFTPTQTEE